MGFREAVLLGFVLLFSGGNLCAATQNFSTNETLKRTPQEQVTQLPRSLQITDHQSNQTQHSDLVYSPVSYRLRSYRLRKPAVSANKQKPLHPLVEQTFWTSEFRELTPNLLELRGTDQAQKLIQGPNLNPTVKQKSKVLKKLFLSQWFYMLPFWSMCHISSVWINLNGILGAGEVWAEGACASW